MECNRATNQWLIVFALAIVVLWSGGSGAFAAETDKQPGHPSFEPSQKEKTLWNEHIRGRPNPHILDDFEICEDVALLSALKKVQPRDPL